MSLKYNFWISIESQKYLIKIFICLHFYSQEQQKVHGVNKNMHAIIKFLFERNWNSLHAPTTETEIVNHKRTKWNYWNSLFISSYSLIKCTVNYERKKICKQTKIKRVGSERIRRNDKYWPRYETWSYDERNTSHIGISAAWSYAIDRQNWSSRVFRVWKMVRQHTLLCWMFINNKKKWFTERKKWKRNDDNKTLPFCCCLTFSTSSIFASCFIKLFLSFFLLHHCFDIE